MKNLSLVFGALLIVTGIASANLWRELRAARQTIAELQTQLAEPRVANREPLLPTQAATATPLTATAPSAQVPAGNADPEQAKAAEQKGREAAATFAAALGSASSYVSPEIELMKDPEYRKARLTQTRFTVARNYPGLAEVVGLSEKEANQIFELMAERQLATTAEMNSTLGAGGTRDPAAVQAMVQRQSAQSRAMEDSIRTLMGNDRYTQYQAYQQTRPARVQASNMGTTLSAAGQPLSDAQSRALTATMIAEQQRQAQEATPLPPSFEEFQTRQEQATRRALEAAAPTLSARQLEVLQAQLDQQAASRRNSASLVRELENRARTQPQGQQASPP